MIEQDLGRLVGVMERENGVNPVMLHSRIPDSDNGNNVQHEKMIADITDGKPLSPAAVAHLRGIPNEEFRALIRARYSDTVEPGDTIGIITKGRPLTPDAVTHLLGVPNDEFRALVRERYTEPHRPATIPTLRPDTATMKLGAHTNLY